MHDLPSNLLAQQCPLSEAGNACGVVLFRGHLVLLQ